MQRRVELGEDPMREVGERVAMLEPMLRNLQALPPELAQPCPPLR